MEGHLTSRRCCFVFHYTVHCQPSECNTTNVLDSLGSQSFDSDSRLSIVNDITMAKEDQSAFDIIELGK